MRLRIINQQSECSVSVYSKLTLKILKVITVRHFFLQPISYRCKSIFLLQQSYLEQCMQSVSFPRGELPWATMIIFTLYWLSLQLPKPGSFDGEGQYVVLTKSGSEWELKKIEDDDKYTSVSFTENRFPVYVFIISNSLTFLLPACWFNKSDLLIKSEILENRSRFASVLFCMGN